jgi:hypothetical protein
VNTCLTTLGDLEEGSVYVPESVSVFVPPKLADERLRNWNGTV